MMCYYKFTSDRNIESIGGIYEFASANFKDEASLDLIVEICF